MRHVRLLAALLLLVAMVSASQEDKKGKTKSAGGAEDQVKALLEQRRQAVLKGDAATLAALTADDYARVGPDGRMQNKTEYLQTFKDGSVKYQSIDVKDEKIRVYGNTAVTTGTAAIKGTNKGQDISGNYAVTQVFVKRNGNWQAVSFHSTKVPG